MQPKQVQPQVLLYRNEEVRARVTDSLSVYVECTAFFKDLLRYSQNGSNVLTNHSV